MTASEYKRAEGELTHPPFEIPRWRRIIRGIGRFAARKPLSGAAAAFIAVIVFVAIFGDLVTPFDPLLPHYDRLEEPPSSKFWLGTDLLGRDVFSRILIGARVSLIVAGASVALGAILGSVIGLLSGYLGGKFDIGVQRVMDGMMSLPLLVLAMTIVTLFGASLLNVVLALAVVLTPKANRIVRGSVLTVKQEMFVEAARAVGGSDFRIMIRHITPNVVAPVIVFVTTSLGAMAMTEAFMSFLGLGVPPPTPTWGGMLVFQGQARSIESDPWLMLSPGIALFLMVLAFNLFGDGIRDVLDPRLKE